MRKRGKGTGLFARYAYVTTALGTKRHRVTNRERAEAYRLRAKHRDILEMATPAHARALTDQVLSTKELVLKYSGEGSTNHALPTQRTGTRFDTSTSRARDDEPLF